MKKDVFFSFLGVLLGAALLSAGVLLQSGFRVLGGILSVLGILVALFSVVETIVLFVRRKSQGEQKANEQPEKIPPEYRRKSSMLTRAEWALYRVLSELYAGKYDVHYQVPLVAVIDKLTQNSYRNELFRLADFLLVDPATTAPLLLIELNDSSHNRADRMERDRKVYEICERAGMPLVVLTPEQARDAAYVKRVVSRHILRK